MSVAVSLRHIHRAGLPSRRLLLHRMRLCLLGGFQLAEADQAIPLGMMVQRLVAFLALSKRPVRRSSLGGILWPETSDERAQANLRSALWRLHRDGLDLVFASADHLSLTRGISIDVVEMIEMARQLLDPMPKAEPSTLDPTMFAADLLPDWDDEWVLVERERLRQLRLHALETLCMEFVRAGRLGAAVVAGLTAVTDEPLRESAHLALITAYLAENNRDEALRLYERYRSRLLSELGLEPSVQLRGLVADLRDAAVMRR
jgi:DNA-binding SARP family transcriptional activator